MLSLPHLLILLLIVLLVFGAGRFPRVMNDVGKGMRALREGLKEETPPAAAPPRATTTIDQPPAPKDPGNTPT